MIWFAWDFAQELESGTFLKRYKNTEEIYEKTAQSLRKVLWMQHWIANNLLGFAFAVNGIELLHLNNVVTGCILLGGLFFYDIFWVFGTNVMVTVAKSFEAPIKCNLHSIFSPLKFYV